MINIRLLFVGTLLLTFFCHQNIDAQIYKNQNSDDELYKLQIAARVISTFYVDTIQKSKLVENAITGMLNKLDPHSVYISSDEVQRMNEPLEGNFEGIGIQFNILQDTLLVVNPIPGGPSEEVGVRAGDRIIYVNDTLVAGVNLTNKIVFQKLRGKKGTIVTVKIARMGTPKLIEFSITRDKIPIFSMDAANMLTSDIGYIKLNRFSATTHDEFLQGIEKLKKQGMKKLVLDLQGNGGGYLQTATKIADEFLSKDHLIVYTKGQNSPEHKFTAIKRGVFENGKLVVLIDEGSASASEILSGAIQDWDRGVVIGRRSFGKGLVQRPFNLPDGSIMRLTTAKYYTPTGRLIQKSYEGGKEKYHDDLLTRYNHGELTNADSIHFPDSLLYRTLINKRAVYGGGGIMPDIFVPLDTTTYSNYHRDLVAKGIVNKFILTYLDHNREQIKNNYIDIDNFINNFECSQPMLDSLINYGEKNEITFNEKEFLLSKKSIALQLKALLGRNLFSLSDFYRIINQDDKVIKQAIEILTDETAYNNRLLLNEITSK